MPLYIKKEITQQFLDLSGHVYAGESLLPSWQQVRSLGGRCQTGSILLAVQPGAHGEYDPEKSLPRNRLTSSDVSGQEMQEVK